MVARISYVATRIVMLSLYTVVHEYVSSEVLTKNSDYFGKARLTRSHVRVHAMLPRSVYKSCFESRIPD